MNRTALLLPVAILGLALAMAQPARAEQAPAFSRARAVWPEGREQEMNLLCGFRTTFEAPERGGVVLRLAGYSLYRIYLNGEFIGHGPARGPHGWFRVDEWELARFLRPGSNLLAVELAGYNIDSYYLPDQPPFLQAELVAEGQVLAATGTPGDFAAFILEERIRKVQRYSFQRTFCESYRLAPGWDDWRTGEGKSRPPVELALQPEKKLLPRRVPYPAFALRQPTFAAGSGRLERIAGPAELWEERCLRGSDQVRQYPREELEQPRPLVELQRVASRPVTAESVPLEGPAEFALEELSYRILDFGANLTGFPGVRLEVGEPARLLLTFDEVLTAGDVDFKRLNCVNIIAWELAPGSYRLESLEPYTLRFLKLQLLAGSCRVEGVTLREYVNPEAGRARFAAADPRLMTLFEAGRETFRQNAVDIFMDCPSRERAGWLCDSYFTARAAFDLCGTTTVEKNYLENYILPDSFPHLPAGMLPMCYPADQPDGRFIPNWALWFVLELEEYLARSGDTLLVERACPRVLALFDYFRPFENGEGLLERLDSWIFIEWSEANDFVQDVNYPSNMLYAAALEAAGRLYGLPELGHRATRVRQAVRTQAFDGEFFIDNALRSKPGKLERTTNRTEVCQNYAFFLGTADPRSHPALWERLSKEFGPLRDEKQLHPEVFKARPFIGNVLRMELLSRQGLTRRVLEECLGYYLPMAEQTGTLWEFEGAAASCNHGFASHISRVLLRDVLGLYAVDPVGKRLTVRLPDQPLEWCRGAQPVPGGEVALAWRKADGALRYRVELPAGWRLAVENSSGLPAVREP